MEFTTAVALALVLCIALWVPYFIVNIRRGEGARPHLVHMVEAARPLGHRSRRGSPANATRAQTTREGLVTD